MHATVLNSQMCLAGYCQTMNAFPKTPNSTESVGLDSSIVENYGFVLLFPVLAFRKVEEHAILCFFQLFPNRIDHLIRNDELFPRDSMISSSGIFRTRDLGAR